MGKKPRKASSGKPRDVAVAVSTPRDESVVSDELRSVLDTLSRRLERGSWVGDAERVNKLWQDASLLTHEMYPSGKSRLIVEADTGRVLGAEVVGDFPRIASDDREDACHDIRRMAYEWQTGNDAFRAARGREWAAQLRSIRDELGATPEATDDDGTRSPDGGPFMPTPADRNILQALDEATTTLIQVDIEQVSGEPTRTVKDRLPVLEEAKLVNRPHGGRRGYAITTAGQQVLGKPGVR